MRYLIFIALLSLGCSTTKTTATDSTNAAPAAPPTKEASYAGDWEMTVSNTPAGTVTGMMTITETADGLAGTYTVDGQAIELRRVARTKEGIAIDFYSSEYQMDVDVRLAGQADSDTLEGVTLGSYDTIARRK